MNTTYDEIFSLLKKYHLSIDDLKEYQEEQEKNRKARDLAVKIAHEKLIVAVGAYGDALNEAYGFSNWDKAKFIENFVSWLRDLESTVATDKDAQINITMKIDSSRDTSSKPNNSKKSAGSGDSKKRDPDTVLREYLKQMGF
jgi:hypothetical protein